MNTNQLLAIEAGSLKAWLEIKTRRLDVDHAAAHIREPEYKEYEFIKAYFPEQTVQSEYRSRAVIAGDVAIIPMHAAIEYRPSIWSDYGYLCSSLAIRNDFNRLVADEGIGKIIFDIDSPGGDYSGCPELAADIYRSRGKKATIALCNPTAASGALWVGSACEKFYAIGSGQVGSIGALILHSDWSQYYTSLGVLNTILRSPENKADFNSLEPLKDETKAYYQERVQAIADEFVSAVAKHRGVTKKVVGDKFGGGRMLTAQQAAAAGLIDGMVDSLESVLGRGRVVKKAKAVRLSPALAAAKEAGQKKKS